ncbi:MAG: DUF2786 domain-containing protein [Myxococcales bacterium]|nr:DUF2786 domain-containing protein [Myxococcales bacterium]
MSAALERLALRAVRDTWEDLNATFFARRLRRPVLSLVDGGGQLGRWSSDERTLWLSRELLARHGWGVVVEVLKHEMAHQYVDEILGLSHEAAHGPAFQEICRERLIDARASGVPSGSAAVHSDHRMLERVAKLLALAESSNEHEAQAAMAAAQRLMLKHNIEHVTRRGTDVYSFRHVGTPTGRVGEHERILAAIIGDHFFVEVIWVPVWRPLEGRRGSVLEICGTVENLELAAYVHGFLLQTSERLWRDYKRAQRLGANAERRTFLSGVMTGFRDKLRSEQRKHAAEGLVWVGDGDLEQFYRRRHPRVRWTRYSCGARSEAYAHGRQAGAQIVLHRGVRSGPDGAVKLLPERRRS